MSVRRYVVLVATALGVLLIGAATAWACTSSAQIGVTGAEEAASPGEQMSVTGRDFYAGGPVQVYWQTGDGEQELLFETTGRSFARPLTVPADAQAGTHLVVAYGYETDVDDEPVGQAAATVQVAVADADSAGATSGAGADQLWSGAATEGSPSLSAADSATTGQPTGMGGQLALAAGLFAVGGLVLGTGTVGALRRRRVPAEAPARRAG